MKVIGSSEITKKYRRNIERNIKSDFCTWKKIYIDYYEPELTEIILDEVIGGKQLRLNLLSYFNIADTEKVFGDYLRRKLMLQEYTGKSQREQLQHLIRFNIQYGSDKFKELIYTESLV